MNKDAATAGRSEVWPYVLDRIAQSPAIGYGREAMKRTGIKRMLSEQLGEDLALGHPHNAYFEMLLDNGAIGLALVVSFFVTILGYSGRLFLQDEDGDPWASGVGGMTLALVLTHMVASMSSQSFYPCVGDCPMWCAIMLMLRVRVERTRAKRLRPAQALGLPRPLRPRPLHQTT